MLVAMLLAGLPLLERRLGTRFLRVEVRLLGFEVQAGLLVAERQLMPMPLLLADVGELHLFAVALVAVACGGQQQPSSGERRLLSLQLLDVRLLAQEFSRLSVEVQGLSLDLEGCNFVERRSFDLYRSLNV